MNKHAERLAKIVEAFPKVTVTVLGDLVADEFVFGEIARVSREAPVLILRHREREVVPGGAANAVYNLADLGVSVLPVGVVGDDEAGRMLLQRFRKKRIPLSGIQKVKGHPTVTKTRILAGFPHSARQQVVRVDFEPEGAPPNSVLRKLVSSARQYVRVSDALLVSDYGYGAATPEILFNVRSAATDCPVTVDSRHRMLEYTGVTAATPNEPEVEEALGIRIGHDVAQLEAAGKQLLRRMGLQALVVTRGKDGMAVFARGHKSVNIPVHGSGQVTDVTGAGDTVIAAFSAAIATGASAEDAARIANHAGGIVVMKRGTATVTAAELLHAVQHG